MRLLGVSQCQATMRTEVSHALLVHQPAQTAFPQHFVQIVQTATSSSTTFATSLVLTGISRKMEQIPASNVLMTV